jgi:uncharacterized protein YqgV (UPF0045/DUF77 family)
MPWGSVAFQVLPLLEGPKERVYAAVDRAIAVVAAAGVKYEVGPCETTMEGDLKELLEIVYRAQEACKEAGVPAVATYIKLFQSDTPSTIEEKVAKYREAGH